MNKLIKKFTTPSDTDFFICVYQNENNGRYAVTTYDVVSKTHDDVEWRATEDEAIALAKDRARKYNFNESRKSVTITESQLKNIIRESIANICEASDWNVLSDTEKKTDKSTLMKLKEAKDILYDITVSGFIPFASPSPSSTEENVKNSILDAIQKIEDAMALTKELYGENLYVHNK